MRLKKALEKLSNSQYKPLEVPAQSASKNQSAEHSNPMVNQMSIPTPTKGPPPLLKSAPEDVDHQLLNEPNSPLFLPAYLHSESADFSPLVDHQTPVQLTLGPCFCTPGAWDPRRKDLIRKFSAVYPKDSNTQHSQSSSLYKEHVNEAAYQLCLRDPTLLVRRDELFILSKRAIDPDCHLHLITPKDSSVDMPFGTEPSSLVQDTLLSKSTGDPGNVLMGHSPKDSRPKKRPLEVGRSTPEAKRTNADHIVKLSTKERLSQMKRLQAEIEANKAFQNVKMIAMEEARVNRDLSTSAALNEHVKLLEEELKELERAYAVLKRKQDRSNRYFKGKSSKDANKKDSNSSHADTLSPIEPIAFEFNPHVNISTGTDLNLDTKEDRVSSVNSQGKVSRNKRKTTPKKLRPKQQATGDPSQSEIQDFVDTDTTSDKLSPTTQGDS